MAAPMQRRRWCGAGSVGGMHVISGVRDPAVSFPLAAAVDDRDERHQANRAVAVSAAGVAVTGLVELVIALVSGSVALVGDALHNLSDVSTSLLVFVGFRASRKAATPRYPYGFERAEDLAGIGVAAVIWGQRRGRRHRKRCGVGGSVSAIHEVREGSGRVDNPQVRRGHRAVSPVLHGTIAGLVATGDHCFP